MLKSSGEMPGVRTTGERGLMMVFTRSNNSLTHSHGSLSRSRVHEWRMMSLPMRRERVEASSSRPARIRRSFFLILALMEGVMCGGSADVMLTCRIG